MSNAAADLKKSMYDTFIEHNVGASAARVVKVVGEAWRRCRARYEAFVGPEPPFYRPIARVGWKRRKASADFLSPSRDDLVDAAWSLDAIDLIPKLMNAYDSAHRLRKP